MKRYIHLTIILLINSFYNLFGQSIVKERLVLLHDKPYYFAGETVHFSVHFIGNHSNLKVRPSELVYVNLLNKENELIAQGSVLTKAGNGDGEFSIKNDLKSGYYELIAYTNHLRNRGPESFFRKRIPIYNKGIKVENVPNIVDVEVAVEGGQLIDGITGRVAVHITDIFGKGIPATVNLISDREILKTIRCDNYGLGTFYFVPDAHKKYEIRVENQNIEKPVLLKIEDGYSLQTRYLNQNIQFIIQTNNPDTSKVTVEINAWNGKLYSSQHTVSRRSPIVLSLPKKSLPNEVLDVVVLDEKDKVINGRSFFIDKADTLEETSITIKNENVKPGDSLQFTIRSSVNNLISMSVLDSGYIRFISDPFAEVYFDSDLLDRCVLSSIPVSELTGTITFDNLILFKKPYHNSVFDFYERENYLNLKGQLVDSKPLPPETKILFFIPGINMTYQTSVDSTGYFSFPMLIDFYGDKKVIFMPVSERHTFDKPEIESYNELSGLLDLERLLYIDSTIIRQLNEYQKLSEIHNAYNYFDVKQNDVSTENPFDVTKIFSTYDVDIDMDDYIALNSMEVVIKEILPRVQLRFKKDQTVLRLYSKELMRSYDEAPIIFIDNTPTLNIDDIVELDPQKVKAIKVVSSPDELQKMGTFAQNGVLIVELKKEKSQEITSVDNSFHASGFFKENENGRPYPDFSNLLFYDYFTVGKGEHNVEINTSFRPSTYTIRLKVFGELSFNLITQDIRLKRELKAVN